MSIDSIYVSEIYNDFDTDDDINIIDNAIKFIYDFTEKAKNKKGFYYSEILKLINYKNINDFYFCNKCNKSYIFYIESKNIVNLDNISYSCECDNKQKLISIDDLENLKININKIKYKLVCEKCGKKFSFFYTKYNENICQYCSNDINNIEEINKFDTMSIYNNINYLIYFAINENNKNNIKFDDSREKMEKLFRLDQLKNMIVTTIINYIIFPNYNLYLTIKNLHNAFFEYCQIPDFPNNNYYFKKLIEINRNKKQIINLKPELNNFVIKVDVRQLKFYENLIERYIIGKFPNLVELNLAENCLYSIKPLLKAEWKNLKYLVLFSNKLSDENISYIENLDAKELISLNLEYNNFTKYELLLAIGNNKKGSYKKLAELKIGYNNFKIILNKNHKKDRKNLDEIVEELKKLDFSSIKVLVANNGGLPQKAIEKILPALRLKNYENIDIRYNDIKHLNFINENKYNNYLYSEGNFC